MDTFNNGPQIHILTSISPCVIPYLVKFKITISALGCDNISYIILYEEGPSDAEIIIMKTLSGPSTYLTLHRIFMHEKEIDTFCMYGADRKST